MWVVHSSPAVSASSLNWSPYFSDAACIWSWPSHSDIVDTSPGSFSSSYTAPLRDPISSIIGRNFSDVATKRSTLAGVRTTTRATGRNAARSIRGMLLQRRGLDARVRLMLREQRGEVRERGLDVPRRGLVETFDHSLPFGLLH